MYKQQRQTPFRTAATLILASGSPRRRELLACLGLEFQVFPCPLAEPEPGSRDVPMEFALQNSRLKAAEVADAFSDGVVLGADTIVVMEGTIMGKPRDRKHALEMLSSLAGRSHEVITACCLIMPGGLRTVQFSVSTTVWLAPQDEDVLRAYVDSGEPLDKAGSYAVQGMGAFMVKRIQGSYTNVVGLPMCELVSTLKDLNVLEVAGRGAAPS
ncbi:MAG TPA: septum formation protein Maf [Thermodesulfobacteriaceae bacterium]|nr:septum formation protein Maf [Thermodesulfobacteriaceae bacterium]